MTRKNFFVKKRQKKDNMLQNILKIIFSDLINYVYTCTKKGCIFRYILHQKNELFRKAYVLHRQ